MCQSPLARSLVVYNAVATRFTDDSPGGALYDSKVAVSRTFRSRRKSSLVASSDSYVADGIYGLCTEDSLARQESHTGVQNRWV